ncbi:MAG: hypothetical protein HY842_06150 [Bacteroidetes bacterium]|nr:hypothetical protein [Bacteroidota bacterium]
MKYIEKKVSNEPQTLKNYRESTANATFKGFGDTGQSLKKALLEEQGHLCAYCMKRISLKRSSLGRDEQATKPMIEVEHYLSQDEFPKKDLDYTKMLGVCNGFSQGDIHCDKSKLETRLIVLNPHDKEVEILITYASDGSIVPTKQTDEVEHDLKLLNLNNENLKKARRDAVDIARELLIKQYPVKDWTKEIIQKEIEAWSVKHKKGEHLRFRPFCQVAIWFLKDIKKRNRYPAK